MLFIQQNGSQKIRQQYQDWSASLLLVMGHGLMDDLLEVVSPETNEFWDSRKTRFWGLSLKNQIPFTGSVTYLIAITEQENDGFFVCIKNSSFVHLYMSCPLCYDVYRSFNTEKTPSPA